MVKVNAKAAANPAAAPGAPAPADAKVKKGKKRSDFATWAEWCEHKKQQCLARAGKLQEKASEWEAKKAGEHLATQEKKLKKMAKLKQAMEAIEAELKAAGIKI